ncbi:tripartite tricarboxylate transporter TctB family protein [Rhodococcus fascians]|nr:tripartite tricarboxylate transporter TctB family protein [Rhodococcus fascians]MBY4004519.1 tripartite tricarboxylate transporter TctB family protein [Rhodococcus fascians]MBY4009300.1 tripartite tricarboxylate transporter TctB family protein [Rhodococcus fascians]MBY4029767.1 tripartite tricarboxylate transporter TctB family protein [Rhodococcus fascians]MBY4045147.1 tripartite tricarboxylate transporter TctB family protein [Rhodococcus fascians]
MAVTPARPTFIERLVRRMPGVVLGLGAIAVAGASWRLGLTHNGSIGPGLWPFSAAVLLLVSAVGIVIGSDDEGDVKPGAALPPRVVVAIIAMAAFAALLTTIGVATAIAVVTLFWLKVLAGEKWLLSLVMSTLLAGIVYTLFIHVLEIPLPVDAFLPR